MYEHEDVVMLDYDESDGVRSQGLKVADRAPVSLKAVVGALSPIQAIPQGDKRTRAVAHDYVSQWIRRAFRGLTCLILSVTSKRRSFPSNTARVEGPGLSAAMSWPAPGNTRAMRFSGSSRDGGHLQHEPLQQRVRQLGDRELLLDDEDRTVSPDPLRRAAGRTCGHLRLHERFYNPIRRHSTLGNISSMNVERAAVA